MRYLDATLATPADNLALDEALLDAVPRLGDVLRLWECQDWAVIVGRASRVEEEVNTDFCRSAKIPILRRCSGGAAVVIGPGCLMYSIVVDTRAMGDLQVIERAHRFVLDRWQQALGALQLPVTYAGTSDLTVEGRKVSGNSLRCKQHALLYHGTLLYDADIARIAQCLRMPPRQPDYRQARTHAEFLTNLGGSPSAIRGALRTVWQATETFPSDQLAALQPEVARLVTTRYAQASWNWLR